MPTLEDLYQLFPVTRENIDAPVFAFDTPPIVQAASHGERALVEMLLAAGANINARSSWWAGGFGVLDNDDHEMAEWLVARGARVDTYSAARHGWVSELRDVHMRGGDGQTPLHVARTVEVAEHLLARGADIDALDVDHESTPAQYALGGRFDVARYLISRGCRTDLLMAAAVGDLALAQKHLDADPACIRMEVNDTWFPMRNPKAGGIIYKWTLGGRRTPHQVAAKSKNVEMLALLMERSPEDLRVVNACIVGDRAMIASLIARDAAAIRALGSADEVTKAAEDNNTEAVRLMIECGWSAEGGGQTPLHWAAWHGNLEMMRLLLAQHPNVDQQDSVHHGTPYGWAFHGEQSGWNKNGDYAGVKDALLKAGAKPSA